MWATYYSEKSLSIVFVVKILKHNAKYEPHCECPPESTYMYFILEEGVGEGVHCNNGELTTYVK